MFGVVEDMIAKVVNDATMVKGELRINKGDQVAQIFKPVTIVNQGKRWTIQLSTKKQSVHHWNSNVSTSGCTTEVSPINKKCTWT